MTTTPPGGMPTSIGFVAHGVLIRAIDHAAGERGETRSHFVRKIIAEHLRAEGFLTPEAPITRHAASRIAGAANV